MSKTYKLVVGDRIEFDVRFSLNDGGEEKPFGMRLTAQRHSVEQQQRDLGDGVKVRDYLQARGVALVAWLGKAPLVLEDDSPMPPGAEALDALYTLVGGMETLVFTSYMQANGVKGRSGN